MNDSERLKLERDLERLKQFTQASAEKEKGTECGCFGFKVLRRVEKLWNVIFGFFGRKGGDSERLSVFSQETVVVIQAIVEQPEFFDWFMKLRGMKKRLRVAQMRQMTDAIRDEDKNSILALVLDRLHDDAMYEGFCQTLEEMKQR